ncbi:PTS sugar transporter subunit IIA [Marinivivus vitaminiproducens]|uniref:PTS sugar transporter subunit IIA n=1 Tax=Marinivivus vitaminiproducens TaxID=3035935 RepID=UPI003FA12DCB
MGSGESDAAAGEAPVGLVLLGFDGLPDAFKAATEHVVGPQDALVAFGLDRSGGRPECRSRLEAAVDQVEHGHGVLVLIDAQNGVAAECARSLGNRHDVRVLSGVNLPMLIKLASVREDQALPAVVGAGLEAGRKYIHVASTLLAVDRS